MDEKMIELQLFIEDNFEPFRQSLMQIVKTDLPTDPGNLWEWVSNFVQMNGQSAAPILNEAISNMQPLIGAAKSNWSGVVDTGLKIIGSLFGANVGGQNNEQFAAFAQAQIEAQRKQQTTLIVVFGAIVAFAVAAFLLVKLKK